MSFISCTYVVSPCELRCTPAGLFGLYFSKKLADQVHDGTPCHPGKRDVCINGKCEVCVLTTISLVHYATKCVNWDWNVKKTKTLGYIEWKDWQAVGKKAIVSWRWSFLRLHKITQENCNVVYHGLISPDKIGWNRATTDAFAVMVQLISFVKIMKTGLPWIN